MSDQRAAKNTDKELWRETAGDYYAPRIFVTEQGGIGIDVGGFVIVKPVREWHKLAATARAIGEPSKMSAGDGEPVVTIEPDGRVTVPYIPDAEAGRREG